jgi:signal transduction histidine kinase
MMFGKHQKQIAQYGLAVVTAAATTVLAIGLPHLIARKASPFIIFAYVVAVLISAWWGGYGPGLISVVMMNLVSPYLLNASWDPRRVQLTRLILSIALSMLVSYIASRRNRDEAELRATNDQLERHVQERTADLSRANVDLRALADELGRSNARLQQTNEELERFAYIASHDLQEPLRTMSAYTQLLKRRYGGKIDADADEMLDFIVIGSRRMQELVVAVMDFSRSSSHVPEFNAVDATSAMAVAKAALKTPIAEQRACIIAEELPVVYCDAMHLSRVFQNLISNALRFRGEAPPVVRVAAGRDGNFWRFSVSDNGVGIAPEHKDRVFELFQRLHSWTKIPGAGIGLAVCKRIVEHHGGRIWVESEVGRGATFHFTVPADDRPVPDCIEIGVANIRKTVDAPKL